MTLRKAMGAVAKLSEIGAIGKYAIAGAVAALNYTQPTLTEGLDILISVDAFGKHASGLLLLAPIESALASMGYREKTDLGYLIEDWPVQFLPAASELDTEALDQAVEIDLAAAGDQPIKVRTLTAEHVVATALKVGRLKDLARIQAFLEQQAVDLHRLKGVLERHNLMDSWIAFCHKAGIANPFG